MLLAATSSNSLTIKMTTKIRSMLNVGLINEEFVA